VQGLNYENSTEFFETRTNFQELHGTVEVYPLPFDTNALLKTKTLFRVSEFQVNLITWGQIYFVTQERRK
jgi:hypothetical protein